jgi:hypothetical protein
MFGELYARDCIPSVGIEILLRLALTACWHWWNLPAPAYTDNRTLLSLIEYNCDRMIFLPHYLSALDAIAGRTQIQYVCDKI